MLLKLGQLTAAYGQAIALEKIQLQIQPGELVAILGPNGAGKSTLMKILYGMVKPDSGEIKVDGQNVSFKSPNDANERIQQHSKSVRQSMPTARPSKLDL